MSPELRQKLIEKILEEHDDETLFNLLKLDLYDIFTKELESKTNEQLLEIIL